MNKQRKRLIFKLLYKLNHNEIAWLGRLCIDIIADGYRNGEIRVWAMDDNK